IRDVHVTGVQTCALPIFSGRLLELLRVKDIQAIVRPAAGKKGTLPSWMGGRFPISANFGAALRHTFSDIQRKGRKVAAELRFLQPLSAEQRRVSPLPGERSEERRVGKEYRCRGS